MFIRCWILGSVGEGYLEKGNKGYFVSVLFRCLGRFFSFGKGRGILIEFGGFIIWRRLVLEFVGLVLICEVEFWKVREWRERVSIYVGEIFRGGFLIFSYTAYLREKIISVRERIFRKY